MITAKKKIMTMAAALLAALWPAAALAQEEQSISAGDTAFVLTSAAMVLFMTVGLGFFYGGLVRRKNILSVLMQCMFMMCLISVIWVLYGYSLAFGPSVGGFIRQSGLGRAEGRGAGAFGHLRHNGSAFRLHDVSGYVRNNHARAYSGSVRGAGCASRASWFSQFCG